MGVNVLEIKAVLRSILISSSVVINVSELNNDFKELMGTGIPYKDLGYDSLLSFLKSVPDVLLVDGSSCYSQVILVESEKSAHVSNLVLKQRSSKKPGSFHKSNSIGGRRRGVRSQTSNKNLFHTPESTKKKSHNSEPSDTVTAKQDYEHSSHESCDKINKSRSSSTNNFTFEQKNHQPEVINEIPPKNNLSIDVGISEQRLTRQNKNTKNLENSSNNEVKDSNSSSTCTKLLRRIDYKNDTLNAVNIDDLYNVGECLELDVSLKTSVKQKNTNYWKGETTSLSRHAKNIDEWPSEEYIASCSTMASSSNTTKNHGFDSRSWLGKNSNQKNKPEKWNSQNTRSRIEKSGRNNSYNKKQNEMQNLLPKTVQDNLHNLMSGFPEGIWCSELPTAYKDKIGQDLDFEKFGYRCLSHLCFDLGNIFHCIKESSCDYKLYDARKPLPKMNIHPETNTHTESIHESGTMELAAAIPELSWDQHECFLPKDAVKLGYQIPRINVADMFEVGICVKVVVAEIYDISKFWIYVDDSKLDRLMSAMQVFYEIHKKYLLPKSLLAEGLHCVVLYRSKFHRAIVLNVMPDENYIKVYYFDYGTLGTVLKSEVWFLTQSFSELPCQAIRARLVDVYPPYEGVTWSPFANYDFTKFSCMKKLTAEIIRVDKHKNLVDIKLKNECGTYISDILVEEKHALFINKIPQKRIEDPNCVSKVRYIHLFPTFEEIENWVVPSMEEVSDFLNTPVTADFLFSQYFSRNVDKSLLDRIEEKMKINLRKKKSVTKFIKREELLNLHSTEEMNSIMYGHLYDPSITENVEKDKSPEEAQSEVDSKNNSWLYVEDDETFARMLRQSRMKKVCSFDKEEDISLSGSLKKVEKSRNRTSRQLSSFSELEKYLSEEDSSKDASKKSSPDLIDLDNGYPISFNSSTNLLHCSEFEQSMLDLARSRKKCQNCLFTESTMSDMENCVIVNPLDLPIPCTLKNNHFSSDLIQFDEEVLTPQATTDTVSKEANDFIHKSIFTVGSDEVSDADDEDSDSKNSFSKHRSASYHSKTYQKQIQIESTETNIAIETNYYDVMNSFNFGVSADLTVPDMINTTDFASNKNEHNGSILNGDQSIDRSKDLVIYESIINELNDECTIEEESTPSNINLMSRNSDLKTDLTPLNMDQSIKYSLNASNTTSFSGNSIVTIDSVEFFNMEYQESLNFTAAIDETTHTDFCTGNGQESSKSIRKFENQGTVKEDFSMPHHLLDGNSDMNIQKCNLTTTEKLSSNTSNALNPLNKSVNSIGSKEYNNPEYLEVISSISGSDSKTCVDNLKAPKDDGNMILYDSSSSTNLYYSCESKESSIPDFSGEENIDFDVDSNSMDASTPLPIQSYVNKDSSFLEEFDIIDISQTLSSNSNERNKAVTLNSSTLSGDSISIEVPTSQLEIDEDVSHVSQSAASKGFKQGNDTAMDLEKTLSSSVEVIKESNLNSTKNNEASSLPNLLTLSAVTNLPEISSSSNSTNIQIPNPHSPHTSNDMRPSLMNARPPPGFPPINSPVLPQGPPPSFSSFPLRYTTVLVPNSIQYPNGFIAQTIPMQCIAAQQQAFMNEVTQYYRTQPIVVLNYNFLPPHNQNGNS